MTAKKQSQVRKQNEQYFDIIKQALPPELQQTANGVCVNESNAAHENGVHSDTQSDKVFDSADTCSSGSLLHNGTSNSTAASSTYNAASNSNAQPHSKAELHRRRNQNQNQNQNHVSSTGGATSSASYMQLASGTGVSNASGNSRESSTQRKPKATSIVGECSSTLVNGHASSGAPVTECNGVSDSSSSRQHDAASSSSTKQPSAVKDELIGRLESELRRLRNDLQSARYTESELRSQISIYEKHEREARETMQQLRHDRDTFETKLNSAQQKFTTEKQALERQLRDERRSKQSFDEKLAHAERERDELRAQLQAMQQATTTQPASTGAGSKGSTNSQQSATTNATGAKSECTGDCRSSRKKLENENRQLREQLVRKSDEFAKLDNEKQSLSAFRQSQADQHERDLKQAQERASHLEKTLSDENRVKMDLVAALGDAKRQLDIAYSALRTREQELVELKHAHEFISALLPGFSLSGPAPPNTPGGRTLTLGDPSLPPSAQYLASQNGTSHSSPSSTPLSFSAPSSSYNVVASVATPYSTVSSSSSAFHPSLYQNSPSVYGAFGAISPFDVAPSPSPTAFSPPVSAAIDAQQRAQSPSATSVSQSGDVSQKSISS